MSYVRVNFELPSSTIPLPIAAGRCPLRVKHGNKTIHAAQPRARVVMVPKMGPQYLGGFWSSLVNGSVKLFKAATGVQVPISVGDGGSPKQLQAPAATAPQQSGPLANVSTTELVVGGMAFSALILALARGR